MGVGAWVIAPKLADSFDGDSHVALFKALVIVLTAGLIWQFLVVMGAVYVEQKSVTWLTLQRALWLQRPRDAKSGKIGGKLWLILIPLVIGFGLEELIPSLPHDDDRDFALFLDTDVGQSFLDGNWAWFCLVVVLALFNTVLGEELLFRGLLLPRMNAVFGKYDWIANGVLFAGYHIHTPWVIPAVLLDTLFLSWPSKRYRSAWIGIIVHSAQSLIIILAVLGAVAG